MPAKKISEYSKNELVTIENVECFRETELAICIKTECPVDFEHPEGIKTSWIPKSQIHDDSEVWKHKAEDGSSQKGCIIIPSWLAQAKDLV
jgi:hypothetical protein